MNEGLSSSSEYTMTKKNDPMEMKNKVLERDIYKM